MSRPGEGNGTSTVTGRICMEAHMLNDVETRKILFIWNDVEFTGSVSGKSQGRLKRSGDLPHASELVTSFPVKQNGNAALMSMEREPWAVCPRAPRPSHKVHRPCPICLWRCIAGGSCAHLN